MSRNVSTANRGMTAATLFAATALRKGCHANQNR